jgi:hypothetical protein
MITNTTSAAAAERRRQKAAEKALERVSRAWGHRISPKDLKDTLPLVNAKLEAAATALEDIWKDAKAGVTTQEHFDMALKAWEIANYEAVVALKAVR